MSIDIIVATARIAHEANRVWCMENGDDSQPSWDNAPDWQIESAINGVEFHIQNPSADDSASHNNWVKEKLEAGWVYGKVKDPNANPPTHPCLVPFKELSEFQQKKDAIFRSIVHSAIGLDNKKGLPVKGYQGQSNRNLEIVNHNKVQEEKILQLMDHLAELDNIDQRWLDIARSDIERGFMALNRSVFQPKRVELTDDDVADWMV